ncbi:hypothetical protein M514_12368 [Trichuris suis]|uniref:Uncharacterized protein n=1 Tax=Trichuris suis TaxID=68888 RepID=A0A085MTV0_9BILA|nr:hypothetical protein M513_12368 [Trichuris suis]KFD60646.1 hypothetical protein M514_12368 [Trichuris suis]
MVVAGVPVADRWCSNRGRYVPGKDVRWFDSVHADAGVLAADPYGISFVILSDNEVVLSHSYETHAFISTNQSKMRKVPS